MSELHLQDKFLIPFFRDGLGYQEVKANTITNSLIIEEDLQTFIATTELNEKSSSKNIAATPPNSWQTWSNWSKTESPAAATWPSSSTPTNPSPCKASNYTCSTPTTAPSITAASLSKISSPSSKNCPTDINTKANKSSHSVPIFASSSTAFTLATAN